MRASSMLMGTGMAIRWACLAVWMGVTSLFVVPTSAQTLANCKGPAELDQAVSKQPTSAAYNALGAYFARRNQFSCAMTAFERALKLNPKSWEAHYNFALALRSTGELKGAASELHQALAENPGAITPRIALGAVLEQVGNLSAAPQQYDGPW